ncbi:uncharacterized protein LY89DRAFT_736061 [Mollisia scopiformis]|uniref:Uncharacterized protein n=1 Tax=Mollisia scopiformis TaxID=149040 RepID=A0A194X4A1_MOLSC|nr:uncharacterized protein LY89DRAFT_736061 [Mollisia scopiformis]KUJ15001.1 hypothetical protein LY89DRAFT_736061 [Mollisia scopiformis]
MSYLPIHLPALGKNVHRFKATPKILFNYHGQTIIEDTLADLLLELEDFKLRWEETTASNVPRVWYDYYDTVNEAQSVWGHERNGAGSESRKMRKFWRWSSAVRELRDSIIHWMKEQDLPPGYSQGKGRSSLVFVPRQEEVLPPYSPPGEKRLSKSPCVDRNQAVVEELGITYTIW